MPELPEVETIRRTLEKFVLNKEIAEVEIFNPVVIKKPDEKSFKKILEGNSFICIQRRGKYLLAYLQSGEVLVTHLRMTGQYVFTESDKPIKKHTHLIFHYNDGTELRYVDIRRFGGFYLYGPGELDNLKGLSCLGPEPLEDNFTVEEWKKLLGGKKGEIKKILLDQNIIAGIGNIYADEILFSAGIHPQAKVECLSDQEKDSLYTEMRRILHSAIKEGGSSIKDYVDGKGESGNFQNYHQVYGRGGEHCLRCGGQLSKIKVAGRGTVYCSKCQKMR